MDEMLTRIKQIQTSLDQLQASVNRLAQQDIDNIKPKIVEAFDVDFIKQVCYENNSDRDVIKLIVIYKHDDYDFASNAIFDRFDKLDDQFASLDMHIMWCSVSEVEPNDLKNTTTVFKRE